MTIPLAGGYEKRYLCSLLVTNGINTDSFFYLNSFYLFTLPMADSQSSYASLTSTVAEAPEPSRIVIYKGVEYYVVD